MTWNDDEELDDIRDDSFTWEAKIGRKSEYFENKSDAVYYILEELDEMSDNKLSENTQIVGFLDFDDIYENLIDVAYDDFYDILKDVIKKLKLKVTIKLISLDNSEPEFGEL